MSGNLRAGRHRRRSPVEWLPIRPWEDVGGRRVGSRLMGVAGEVGGAGYAAAIRLMNGSGDAGLACRAESVSCELRGGTRQVTLPVHYRRADVFMAIFPARYRWLKDRLPDGLRPLWLGSDRAPLAVTAFNYLESSIDPYGEVAILIPCTRGAALPGLVVSALDSLYPGFGFFVMHLPVTSDIADVLGRSVWGYPKFVADIDFRRGRDHQRLGAGLQPLQQGHLRRPRPQLDRRRQQHERPLWRLRR